MSRLPRVIAFASLCAIGATYGLTSAVAAEKAKGKNRAAERGRYLVTLGGCNDCHSPKVFTPQGPHPDESRLLSGHPADEKLPAVPQGLISPKQWGAITTNDLTAWVGPWGTSFAANLTPDKTGTGDWTAQTFIKTMRTGKHMGEGRPILPPMPWQDFGKLTDGDLRAIFAYLQTLKPVSNSVPPPIPPVPAPSAAK